jgi:hypothetical protein
VLTSLLLSSILSGLAATAVMVLFLYLPLLWNGVYYDTLAAIGAIWTRQADARSRLIGAMVLFSGGVAVATFYGAFALMFMTETGGFRGTSYLIFPAAPTTIDLFFPLLGLVGGLGQGIFLSLIGTFLITDFHPLERFRDPFPLILSFVIGHTVYGVVVMFFQHQLLQLLL